MRSKQSAILQFFSGRLELGLQGLKPQSPAQFRARRRRQWKAHAAGPSLFSLLPQPLRSHKGLCANGRQAARAPPYSRQFTCNAIHERQDPTCRMTRNASPSSPREFTAAALEFHRGRMAEKGYRMEGSITPPQFQNDRGGSTRRKTFLTVSPLFAVTFVKRDG